MKINYSEMANEYNAIIFDLARRSAYPIMDIDFVRDRLYLAPEDFEEAEAEGIHSFEDWDIIREIGDWLVDEMTNYYDLAPEDWYCDDPCESTDWELQLQGYYDIVCHALYTAYGNK